MVSIECNFYSILYFRTVLITRVIKEGKANMAKSKALPLFAFILPLFYVSWTIYQSHM